MDSVSFLFVMLAILFVLVYFPANAYATPANIPGYSQYTGEGFSLQYPSYWTIQQNDMPAYPGGAVGEGISMFNSQFPEFAIASLDPIDAEELKNMTQADIESYLEQIFPTFLKGVISEIKRGTLTELENPIYDKYVIDGHKAGSAYYTATYEGIPFRGLVIGTIVGQNVFAAAYRAPEAGFDQNFPIAENMIKSIKFLQPLTATDDVQNQTKFAQLQSGDNTRVAPNNTNATTDTTTPLAMNTYENPEWGISIQYPSDWRASTIGLEDYTDLIAFYPPLENFTDLFPTQLIISASRYSQNISLPVLTNFTLTMLNQSQQALDRSQETVEIKSSAEVTVAGHPGHRIVLAHQPFQNNTLVMNTMNIWATVGDKLYLITYVGEETRFNRHLPEVGRILESIDIHNT